MVPANCCAAQCCCWLQSQQPRRAASVPLTRRRFLNNRPMRSGVFRIWQRGAWRARKARTYNRGLGAEPPAGSRGRAHGRGVRGGKAPLKLKHFLLLNVQWKPQIRPFFLQKRTFSYEVACKKFSWSGQRGGIAPCPPLNMPLKEGNPDFYASAFFLCYL